ncbi:MAG: class I SAM-dependent methyltransferase [candidate division WOR-3 bacterium]|nr:class I SAM-dependent methyltransferase [candidate division WOR-3 bacterium]
MLKRFIRRLLDRNSNLIEQIGGLPVEDYFKDSYSNEYKVLKGLKDLLKPGWQKNLNREFTFQIPGRKESQMRLRSSAEKLRDMSIQLEKHGVSLRSRKVLEVGCYGGTVSMLMQRDYNTRNTAIDLPRYYITQRNEDINTEHIDEQVIYLEKLRNVFLGAAGLDSSAVEFVDDDITDSGLGSDSFDFIFSFETLEHVTDPRAMFKELHRLLKPGGYMFHHYNPFFSLTGGHSYATTDILWGHALLDIDDIQRYFRHYRPEEEQFAMSFLKSNLNRMTIGDLKAYINNRFSVIDIFSQSNYDYSKILSNDWIDRSNRLYPSLISEDMVSDSITIILKSKD